MSDSNAPQPLPHPSIDQCLFCRNRLCFVRIFTTDLRFDEVACAEHVSALERYADVTLGIGPPRTHISGTGRKTRSPFKARLQLLSSEATRVAREIDQILDDAANWNRAHPYEAIDPDPEGMLRRLRAALPAPAPAET